MFWTSSRTGSGCHKAGLKTHEENRNGGVDALDGVRHSLPAFVHGGIDVTVAQQRTVEGGRERACVRHENEVLHGDDCGDTEPDDLRGDGSERRRVFGHRSSSPAGLEHDQLQSVVDPTRQLVVFDLLESTGVVFEREHSSLFPCEVVPVTDDVEGMIATIPVQPCPDVIESGIAAGEQPVRVFEPGGQRI